MSQSMDYAAREFDVGDAAFHVFKHAGSGRMGGLILIFAVYVIAHVLLCAAAFWAIYPFVTNFQAFVQSEPETFSELMAQTGRVWLLGIGAFLFTWIFYAVIDAALLRWFYGRSAVPRFGEAEFQLMIIAVFWAILLPVLWIPNLALWAASLALESTALMALSFLFVLVSLWLMIWAAVKFAPAAALTVYTGRFSFFRAFGATKKVFWAMLGAFLVAFVIYFAFSMAVSIVGQITLVVGAGFSFGDKMFIAPETVSDAEISALLQQFFGRDALIILGIFIFLSLIPQFLLQASFAGVNAYRVKQQAGLNPPPTVTGGDDTSPSAPEPEPEPVTEAREDEEDAGIIPVASAAAPIAVAPQAAEADSESSSEDMPDADDSASAEAQDGDTSSDAVAGAIAALDEHEQADKSDPAEDDEPVKRREEGDEESRE